MAQRTLEHRVEHLERQMTIVEQILPTLATKADLLATKAEFKADLKAATAETRRHFDVVAEGLRVDVHMIAEGLVALQASVDVQHTDVMRLLDQHDRRLLHLEASRTKRR